MSCRVALIALAVAVAIPYGLDIPALRDSSAVRSAFDAAAPLVDSLEHYLVAKFEQNKLPDWFSRMGVRLGLWCVVVACICSVAARVCVRVCASR